MTGFEQYQEEHGECLRRIATLEAENARLRALVYVGREMCEVVELWMSRRDPRVAWRGNEYR